VRDEISIFKASGYLDYFDGRYLDLDQAEKLKKRIERVVRTIRRPLLKDEMIDRTIYAVHQDDTLEKFAHLHTNIVIIGPNKLTFLYA
jgi:hypothetical protein